MLDEFDGVFFTGVNFYSDENQVYVINKNPAMVIFLDKEFNVNTLVERRGNGPDDISFPNQLLTSKYGLLVEDLGNSKISLINPKNGEFIEEFFIPEPVNQGKFLFDGEDTFYFPVVGYKSDSASVLKVNMKGEITGKLGQKMPQKEGDFNRQVRIIQRFEDNDLILIGINLPFVDIITPQGELVKRHTLDQFEPIKRALDSLEKDMSGPGRERNPKEVQSIIIDCQYSNGKLYATFTDRIGMDRTKARHLLEFELDKESIELTRVFRFQTDTPDDNLHPYAFHVDHHSKKIYTQGLITKQIYVFDLPD